MTASKPEKPAVRRKRGQNEGSIYQLADGRWCAIVPARHSPTGKRHIIYGSLREGTNTRDDVARKLHKYLAGESGPVLRPDQHTVESYLKVWMAGLTEDGDLRPKTRESYGYSVTSLIVPHIGAVKLQALTAEHVRYMMRRLRDEKRAERTVRYARSVLGIALGAVVRRKIIMNNPASREALGSSERRRCRARST